MLNQSQAIDGPFMKLNVHRALQECGSKVRYDMRRDRQSKKRLLIVEDELPVLNLMIRVMKSEGYEVEGARNGQDAFDRIREKPFDLIICDVKMPDFDVEAFHEEIQREHPVLQGRIAFVTGDTASSETAEFLDKAGAPYLLKPFDLYDLKKIVNELLWSSRRRHQLNEEVCRE